jgi:hypothetical protein
MPLKSEGLYNIPNKKRHNVAGYPEAGTSYGQSSEQDNGQLQSNRSCLQTANQNDTNVKAE